MQGANTPSDVVEEVQVFDFIADAALRDSLNHF